MQLWCDLYVYSNAHLNSKFFFRYAVDCYVFAPMIHATPLTPFLVMLMRFIEGEIMSLLSFSLITSLYLMNQFISRMYLIIVTFSKSYIFRFYIMRSDIYIQLIKSICYFKHCCRQNKINLLLSFLQHRYRQKNEDYNNAYSRVNNHVDDRAEVWWPLFHYYRALFEK